VSTVLSGMLRSDTRDSLSASQPGMTGVSRAVPRNCNGRAVRLPQPQHSVEAITRRSHTSDREPPNGRRTRLIRTAARAAPEWTICTSYTRDPTGYRELVSSGMARVSARGGG
jgi:hypothetical protein